MPLSPLGHFSLSSPPTTVQKLMNRRQSSEHKRAAVGEIWEGLVGGYSSKSRRWIRADMLHIMCGQKKRENNSKAADSLSCWDSLKLILSVTAELAFTQREIQQKWFGIDLFISVSSSWRFTFGIEERDGKALITPQPLCWCRLSKVSC